MWQSHCHLVGSPTRFCGSKNNASQLNSKERCLFIFFILLDHKKLCSDKKYHPKRYSLLQYILGSSMVFLVSPQNTVHFQRQISNLSKFLSPRETCMPHDMQDAEKWWVVIFLLSRFPFDLTISWLSSIPLNHWRSFSNVIIGFFKKHTFCKETFSLVSRPDYSPILYCHLFQAPLAINVVSRG